MSTRRPGSVLAIVLLLALAAPSLCLAPWATEPLLTSDLGSSNFGTSLALSPSGEKLAVGAPSESFDGVSNAGAVRVFIRNIAGKWALQARIQAIAPVATERLGDYLVMTEDRIVAGSPNFNGNRGKVTPIALIGSTWTVQPELTISGTAIGSEYFGYSLYVYEDYLAVSCAGCLASKGQAYYYKVDSSTNQYTLLTTLSKSDSKAFGGRVALNLEFLVLGAPEEGSNRGCAYVFERNSDSINPTPTRLTTATDIGANGYLGMDVVVASPTVVVVSSGANVYVFSLAASSWSQSDVLLKPSGANFFGTNLAITPTILVISSLTKMFISNFIDGQFSPPALILPDGFDAPFTFGEKISAAGNTIVTSNYYGPQPAVITFSIPVPPKVTTVSLGAKSKSENLGYSVAIHNNIALVAVPFCFDTDASCDGGYFMYYTKTDSGDWVFVKRIRNPFRNRDNKFGVTMQVNDNYLILSAPDSVYDSTPSGVIVFFTWVLDKRTDPTSIFVKNSIIRFRKTDKDYNLGSSLSNYDKVTAVGMPEYNVDSKSNAGAAHIFQKKDDGKWGQRKTITSPSPAADEHFGQSVSLQSESRVAISNWPSGSSTNGVSIYNLFEGEWVFFQTLQGDVGPKFGWKASFFEEQLYVSALGDATTAGSITIYTPDSEGKYEGSQVLQADGGADGEQFGYSFSTDGVRLAVGAKPCDNGATCGIKGSVYAFYMDGSNWAQQYRYSLGAADGSDGFGFSVAIKGDTVLVSAPFDSTNNRKGTAYFIQK